MTSFRQDFPTSPLFDLDVLEGNTDLRWSLLEAPSLIGIPFALSSLGYDFHHNLPFPLGTVLSLAATTGAKGHTSPPPPFPLACSFLPWLLLRLKHICTFRKIPAGMAPPPLRLLSICVSENTSEYVFLSFSSRSRDRSGWESLKFFQPRKPLSSVYCELSSRLPPVDPPRHPPPPRPMPF